MPLSEHEQRVLEQIERSLLDEDPKFASAVRASDPRQHALRRVVGAGILFLLGVVLLISALLTKFAPGGVPVLGLASFVVMVSAALIGAQAYRKGGRTNLQSSGSAPSIPKASKRVDKPSFFQRLEERWKRRRGESF